MKKIEIYNSRKINCYDINRTFLHQYKSITETERILKINKTPIINSCKRLKTRLKDYIFRYNDDDEFK